MVLAARGEGFYRSNLHRSLLFADNVPTDKALVDVQDWLGFPVENTEGEYNAYLDALQAEREEIFLRAKD
jgi:hypothetical protein